MTVAAAPTRRPGPPRPRTAPLDGTPPPDVAAPVWTSPRRPARGRAPRRRHGRRLHPRAQRGQPPLSSPTSPRVARHRRPDLQPHGGPARPALRRLRRHGRRRRRRGRQPDGRRRDPRHRAGRRRPADRDRFAQPASSPPCWRPAHLLAAKSNRRRAGHGHHRHRSRASTAPPSSSGQVGDSRLPPPRRAPPADHPPVAGPKLIDAGQLWRDGPRLRARPHHPSRPSAPPTPSRSTSRTSTSAAATP